MSTGSLSAALIIALGGVVAALASIYLWRHRVRAEKEIEREMELRRRRDRVRGLLVATQRVIAIAALPLRQQFSADVIEQTRRTFLENVSTKAKGEAATTDAASEEKETPQGAAIEMLIAFDDLKGDLDLLPVDVIDAIVAFFDHDRRMTALVRAFSAGMYEHLADDRQSAAVDGLMRLGEDMLSAADQAQKAIDRYLASPPQ
ncbi:hypothetical protein [Salinarimonas ramus]|uniref:Uncharacterized protein n=1 Tax=Salinarimonas ramus TaxID=690164 RepID=A0A917V5S3_9HYPH|nr:hypothetical protein [Salinarimonas ramus]GGK41491.1 hypothetical protein GCM10011322_30810 [Salinarimonas ramus]